MVIFFVFSLMLGAALQLTNAYGDSFLQDPTVFPKGSLINNFSTIILSVSQISETLFILAIPFFMKRFGIKNVMLLSMAAWVLRFALFGLAGNSALGFTLIIASCIIYGMAFDFFNISGSLYVDKETAPEIRASAQGVFMIMTNGFGAFIGSYVAGWVVEAYGWPLSWYIFAAYALVVAVLFALVFKYKHNPDAEVKVTH